MVFCNNNGLICYGRVRCVTILILIDGFLQSLSLESSILTKICHNPYFNRWFSAIPARGSVLASVVAVTILILIDGFLQYLLQRWRNHEINVTILILIDGFLQCGKKVDIEEFRDGHNPYFNRWFSAIIIKIRKYSLIKEVTILILIDGFLQ